MVMGQDLQCVLNVKRTPGTVHYGYDTLFLDLHKHHSKRGDDLLKEQLYKVYDVAYFQNAKSHVVPPN